MIKLSFTIALLLIFTHVNASELIFITHDIEGCSLIDNDGELRGKRNMGRRAFQLELVREMRIIMGHTERDYSVLPFLRGLHKITENEGRYALFNAGRVPEREGKMKWVGPLTRDKITAYQFKHKKTSPILTLDQARKSHVCVAIGGNKDDFVTDNNFVNITRNISYASCFKMLSLKRVDIAIAAESDLPGILNSTDIAPNKIQAVPFTLFEVLGYLAFSNQVPDSEVMLWQSALDQIIQSGRYDELARDYLHTLGQARVD